MQLRHRFMFLGSHLPLQVFVHFMQFPSNFSAYPLLHMRQMDELLSLHCWQPFLHPLTHILFTKLVPTMQVRHCVKLVGLQVRQLPKHGTQLPLTKFKLSAHVVHTVVELQILQPLGHGLHILLININLSKHCVHS